MTDAPPPGRPRLKWALVASLGLNLVFAGLSAAALFRGPPPPPMPGLWHYARALPDPYRRDLGRALRQHRHDWIGPREALRGKGAAMSAALTAEPFDPAAVAAVLASETKLIGDLSARVKEILGAQPSDQRVLFLAADDSLNYEGVLRIVDLAKAGVEDLQIGVIPVE